MKNLTTKQSAVPKREEYSIDATGKTLGRVATETAKALMGKTSPFYTPNVPSQVHVTVSNAKKLHITEKKRLQKKYTDYSGHPGGLRVRSLSQMIATGGNGAAIRRAVMRMLPRNTLRNGRLKRLIIND